MICGVTCALIQKKMSIVNFVNVLLASQTWVKRHYAVKNNKRTSLQQKDPCYTNFIFS